MKIEFIMQFIYDENKCIGCGACEIASPGLWAMSAETGKAQLIGSFVKKGIYYLTILPNERGQAKKSQVACPTKAILLQ